MALGSRKVNAAGGVVAEFPVNASYQTRSRDISFACGFLLQRWAEIERDFELLNLLKPQLSLYGMGEKAGYAGNSGEWDGAD
jgi:hypothetical protein